jgi:hypothetical protein
MHLYTILFFSYKIQVQYDFTMLWLLLRLSTICCIVFGLATFDQVYHMYLGLNRLAFALNKTSIYIFFFLNFIFQRQYIYILTIYRQCNTTFRNFNLSE